MCFKRGFFCLLWLMFFLTEGKGQPTEKLYKKTEIRADFWGFSDSLYRTHWFVQANLRYTFSGSTAPTVHFLPFHYYHLMLGRQWQLSEHWQIGVLVKGAARQTGKLLFSGGFLQHTGTIGKLRLDKKLEWTHILDSRSPPFYAARTSAILRLCYPFEWKKQTWTPEFSYALLSYQHAKKSPLPPQTKRRIDRSRLKIGLTLAHKSWLFSLFFLKETDYFFAEELRDAQGKIKKPFRKLNLIMPVWGLRLCYVGNKKNN